MLPAPRLGLVLHTSPANVSTTVRTWTTVLGAVFLIGALGLAAAEDAPAKPPAAPAPAPAPKVAEVSTLGLGASPGNAKGPGGFVPRGSARNFYAGRGGRLWYYMNLYYWASKTVPSDLLKSKNLWIHAKVVEKFTGLRRWPDGKSVKGPKPKVTIEYWQVGPTGRSIRLDNHRDYCLLADQYTAGAIEVTVTLTQGRLAVKDDKGRWGAGQEPYLLESRNYATGGGIGADRARFTALSKEAVTQWGYRVPWSTHPQRLTRSNWQKLDTPEWAPPTRRAPAPSIVPAPVVTPTAGP